jgi:hypothetical protein
VGDRTAGLLLFLPVPLVLWLFTRMPLGAAPSLILGVLLVATHRPYARPFALSRAGCRCLWCGGSAADGLVLTAREPLGVTDWRACGPPHHDAIARVLGFTARHARVLKIGILGSLGVFLAATFAAAAGWLGAVTPDDAVAVLRLGIAATVLPLGWLGERLGRPGREPPPVPFPLHIQALIGTRAVLWLFRLVGLAWLFLGAHHVASRLGLVPTP